MSDIGSASTTATPELAQALLHGPFEAALSVAISQSGMSLREIQGELLRRGHQVATSTLSYWQQGKRRPYGANASVVSALEQTLTLPPEALRSLLPPDRLRGPGAQARTPVGLQRAWVAAPELVKMFTEFGGQINRLETLAVNEHAVIDGDRRLASIRTDIAAKAIGSGVDRMLFVYNGASSVDVTRVQLDDLRNCRIGRRRSLPASNFLAVELVFDHILQAGESYLYGFTLRTDLAFLSSNEMAARKILEEPEREAARVFSGLIHSYVLQVSFSTASVPIHCNYVRWSHFGGPAHVVEPRSINGYNNVHLSLQGVASGMHGLRWSWGDED